MIDQFRGVRGPALRVGLTGVAVATALVFFLPYAWMVSASLRPDQQIFSALSPLSIHILLPQSLSLDSYVALFQGHLARSVLNLVVMTIGALIPGLLLSAMAAFALSVLRLPFRNALFALVVVSFMIPFETVAIPLSGEFRSWGLQNSFPGLILPGIANGLAVFLLRQFFLGIPIELKEAATIDGASLWTIFWRIYMPLSRPALVAAGMLFFLFQWSSYFWPLLIVTQEDMNVAPVALFLYLGATGVGHAARFGPVFAGSALISLVPAGILLLFQRYFTQSVALQGLK